MNFATPSRNFSKCGEPREALVLLFGLLGDVLSRTPFIREFKNQFSDVKITCIVDPVGAEILAGAPNIDKIIVINRDKQKKFRYFCDKIKLLILIKKKKYQYCFDLYDNPTTRKLTRFCRAEVKLGINEKTGIRVGVGAKIAKVPYKNHHHISNPALDLMKYFWADGVNLDPRPVVDLTAASISLREKTYLDAQISVYPKFFAISLGSGDVAKCMPSSVAELICRRVAREGLTPFIIRNPGQEHLQVELSKLLGAQDLQHLTLASLKLSSLIYLFQRARMVVAPDSGLMHIALAVKCPLLALFTVTPPAYVQPISGPFEPIEIHHDLLSEMLLSVSLRGEIDQKVSCLLDTNIVKTGAPSSHSQKS